MGDLLHLNDAHEQTQLLLPWRANGTLEPEDAALVEAHLEDCERCRSDLSANQTIREHYALISATPASVAPGRAEALLPSSRVAWLRRRVPVGWGLAAPAAIAAAAAVALVVAVPTKTPSEDYRLLGSGTDAAKGNAIVLFAPGMAERDLRAALDQAGAKIVDGPTASGAFVVRLNARARAPGIARLRDNEQVLLAEPIDPSDGP